MRDVLPELLRWWRSGEVVGLATVVATFQSAPRPPGASMLVGPRGEAVGSVSGGCVESAVYDLAQDVVASGAPVLERYGVSDADALAVGLTCGGILDVFVEPVSTESFPQLGSVADDIESGRPVAVATVVEHPDAAWLGRRLVVRPEESGERGSEVPPGTMGSARADAAVTDDARGLLALGRTESLTYGPDGERRGEGMRVVVEWPHRYLAAEVAAGRVDSRTVICVLTHDPKFDVPVLEAALRLPEVAYVGAMGSRRTHEQRIARLRDAGLGDAELARLASPIGLDLGARTPEETAVSIAAEIVALRWGGGGARLHDVTGPIHHHAT